MAHDAQEAQQHDGLAQQLEALHKAGSLVGHLLPLDGGEGQQQGCQDADDAIHGEQHPPAKAPGRHGGGGAPHGDIRGHEGGYGLHELTEGHGAGQLVTLDDVGDERVQRGLHEGVANSQEGEGGQHESVALSENGEDQGYHRHHQGKEHGVFPADAVHQDARGNGEDEEPEEDQGGEDVGGGVAELQVGLDIVGGDAHEVHKPHGEEAQHHRYQLYLFIHYLLRG